MDLGDLISIDSVVARLPAKSKKQVLQALSAQAAELTGLPERESFDTLLQREKLGSTALGHGVALPHARTDLSNKAIGAFIKIKDPINFDSPDGQPADRVEGRRGCLAQRQTPG